MSRKLFGFLSRAFKSEDGTPAAEYGVFAAAVCLVVAGVVWGFGEDIANTFVELKNGLQNP